MIKILQQMGFVERFPERGDKVEWVRYVNGICVVYDTSDRNVSLIRNGSPLRPYIILPMGTDIQLLLRALGGYPVSVPIDKVKLSVRARKACRRLNVATLTQLGELTEHQLLNTRHVGPTTVAEIKNVLSSVGLTLRLP